MEESPRGLPELGVVTCDPRTGPPLRILCDRDRSEELGYIELLAQSANLSTLAGSVFSPPKSL
jgi:hypothetical protein